MTWGTGGADVHSDKQYSIKCLPIRCQAKPPPHRPPSDPVEAAPLLWDATDTMIDASVKATIEAALEEAAKGVGYPYPRPSAGIITAPSGTPATVTPTAITPATVTPGAPSQQSDPPGEATAVTKVPADPEAAAPPESLRRSLMQWQQTGMIPQTSAGATDDLVALSALGVLPPPPPPSSLRAGYSQQDIPMWQQVQRQAERQLERSENWWNRRPKVVPLPKAGQVRAMSGPPSDSAAMPPNLNQQQIGTQTMPAGSGIGSGAGPTPDTPFSSNGGGDGADEIRSRLFPADNNTQYVENGSMVEIVPLLASGDPPPAEEALPGSIASLPSAPLADLPLQHPQQQQPASMTSQQPSGGEFPTALMAPPPPSVEASDVEAFMRFQQQLSQQQANGREGQWQGSTTKGAADSAPLPQRQQGVSQAEASSKQETTPSDAPHDPSMKESSGPLWQALENHFHPQPEVVPQAAAPSGASRSPRL